MWDYATGTTRWAGDTGGDGGTDAGCSVSGTDYNGTSMGGWTYTSGDAAGVEYAVALNTAQFTSLVSANYGLVARSGDADWKSAIASSDHATTGYRPKLVVEYTEAGGGTPEISESESLAVSDAASVVLGALTISKSETLTVSGSIVAQLINLISTAETVSLSDNALLALHAALSVADSITVSESQALDLLLALSAADAATAADAAQLDTPLAALIADAITAGDTASVSLAALSRAIAEALSASDSPSVAVESLGGITLSIGITADLDAYTVNAPLIVG